MQQGSQKLCDSPAKLKCDLPAKIMRIRILGFKRMMKPGQYPRNDSQESKSLNVLLNILDEECVVA
jgi:hypothetical protein